MRSLPVRLAAGGPYLSLLSWKDGRGHSPLGWRVAETQAGTPALTLLGPWRSEKEAIKPPRTGVPQDSSLPPFGAGPWAGTAGPLAPAPAAAAGEAQSLTEDVPARRPQRAAPLCPRPPLLQPWLGRLPGGLLQALLHAEELGGGGDPVPAARRAPGQHPHARGAGLHQQWAGAGLEGRVARRPHSLINPSLTVSECGNPVTPSLTRCPCPGLLRSFIPPRGPCAALPAGAAGFGRTGPAAAVHLQRPDAPPRPRPPPRLCPLRLPRPPPVLPLPLSGLADVFLSAPLPPARTLPSVGARAEPGRAARKAGKPRLGLAGTTHPPDPGAAGSGERRHLLAAGLTAHLRPPALPPQVGTASTSGSGSTTGPSKAISCGQMASPW